MLHKGLDETPRPAYRYSHRHAKADVPGVALDVRGRFVPSGYAQSRCGKLDSAVMSNDSSHDGVSVSNVLAEQGCRCLRSRDHFDKYPTDGDTSTTNMSADMA